MRFYESGSPDAPSLLLLPGTCCHWKQNFGHVLPLLERDFRVICASYDGFDEMEDAIFPDMLTETEHIEDYILRAHGGRLTAAYGCSLGGSFVGLLVERGRVHMDHAILGSSDLDQESGLSAQFKAWLIARVLHSVMQKGVLPRWMQKRLAAKPPEQQEYMTRMLGLFGLTNGSMRFVQRESIRRQFLSDLVTPIGNDISQPNTTVHCFYAAKMGDEYLRRYRQHFAAPDVIRHDLQHEELLLMHPEDWAAEVRRVCGLK